MKNLKDVIPEMSHNIYTVDLNSPEEKSTTPCYLIKIENYFNGKKCEEIIPANNITTAIRIASESNKICTLYERAGSVAKNWRYLCDISSEVI